jgi:hypothetical protein
MKLGPSAYKSELILCRPGYSVVTGRYINIDLFDTDVSNASVICLRMITGRTFAIDESCPLRDEQDTRYIPGR